jgi:hypothetical protein
MATFITNPLPASDAKIRFMEPYVSNGLNRRTVGIIPEGIYRGYNVSAVGTTVTVAADVTTMDSVAVCETLDEALAPNQFQLTVRHEGDILLDFSGLAPADYPNAVVLETVYDLTGTAPLTGVTTVTIKVLDLVDVLPEHVVLCQTTLVGPNVIISNTAREDLGGALVTQDQLSTGGTQFTEAQDDFSGTFGTGAVYPAFSPIPSPIGAFTQGGTVPSDVAVHVTAQSDAFSSLFFIDTSILGIALDAGPIRVVGSTSNGGFGDGRGCEIGGSIKFPAVPPGPHTFILHLSQTAFSSAVKRLAIAPLRMVIFHK